MAHHNCYMLCCRCCGTVHQKGQAFQCDRFMSGSDSVYMSAGVQGHFCIAILHQRQCKYAGSRQLSSGQYEIWFCTVPDINNIGSHRQCDLMDHGQTFLPSTILAEHSRLLQTRQSFLLDIPLNVKKILILRQMLAKKLKR